MDREQIQRELSFIQARIADAQQLITRYREKIAAHQQNGRSAEFEMAMLGVRERAWDTPERETKA